MDPAMAKEVAALARNRTLNEAIERGDSEIQQFYKDATILITGGTGFLGKQLIEKLFRSCEIKKVYMLMRPMRWKAFYERLSQTLEDPVFDNLKKQKPDFANSIYPVHGDMAEPGLGISEQDRALILEEVDIIIHGAAASKFDVPLKIAAYTNVRGTLEIIELAKSCPKLKSVVYISSAYSQALSSKVGGEVIREDFYKPLLSPELLVEMASTMEEERLDSVTTHLIQDWLNTSTFTKAIAEEACRQAGAKLPICVVRPALVICSNQEPSPGWVDESCVYGPTGLLVGAAIGGLHVVNHQNVNIDLVPVDFVNNAIIAAGWASSSRNIGVETEPKIYTVSSSRNPISLDKVIDSLKSDGLQNYPSPKMKYYPFLIETSSKLLTTALVWLLHAAPAYALDLILWLAGYPQKIIKLYSEADKLSTQLNCLMVNEWKFDDYNLQQLLSSLSNRDRDIYNFDAAKLDWHEQSVVWTLGARKYIMKDGLEGTEYAKKKMQWLKVLHYFIVLPLYALLLWNCVSFALTGLVSINSCLYGLFY